MERFHVQVGTVLQRNQSILDVDCPEPDFAEWFISEADYWRGQYLRVTSVDGEYVGLMDRQGQELNIHRDDINATVFIPD